MKNCPDLEALISIQDALDWDAESAMRHIIGCEVCLSSLRQVQRVHGALNRSLSPSPDFTDRVLAALPRAPSGRANGEERRNRLISSVIFVLATVTALPLFVVAGVAPPSAPGPELIAFASLMGFAAIKLTAKAR